MDEKLPENIQAKIDNEIPDLSIHLVDVTGWEWTFRCVESAGYFDSWEEALLDFAAEQTNVIDTKLGLGEEE